MLKLAVIGKTGQLAQALAERIEGQGVEAVFYGRAECDLSQPLSQIEAFMRHIPKPDVLILAAAYTNVDGAESARDLAFAVNAEAPGVIAKVCAERDIPIVHISTDCVFDGKGLVPYTPEDPTCPVNVYGASKLAGERAVQESGALSVILRTSWVYGARARNFLAIMLSLAQSNREVRVVEDHIGCPTNVLHLADAVLMAARGLMTRGRACAGLYHVCGAGAPVSRADFARAIFISAAKLLPYETCVIPVKSQEFPTPAARPEYCALDTCAFEHVFNWALPAWDDGLERCCNEWFEGE